MFTAQVIFYIALAALLIIIVVKKKRQARTARENDAYTNDEGHKTEDEPN